MWKHLCVITPGCAAASGYSSRLFVKHESAYLDSIALRLQHGLPSHKKLLGRF